MHASEMRRCLSELDVSGIRKLWAQVGAGMSQPVSEEYALVTLHMARTASNNMTVQQRSYSHSWLRERGYLSQLPDHLKKHAERLYPKIVDAVGISVNFKSDILKPVARQIELVMADAVEDAYAEGRKEPAFVRERMNEASARERRKLFG